ncbi:type II secretion system ATPase GspE [Desulforhopalus singaporensis]|uniref:protein-secreting ATPase n=1 Tax=Desulforhopalus singaporensis TaxID=91360 RepID=A0A1H0M0Z3_9BACT|nr:type II secretion system ATPase GspE [Desulforhopalus singaporensis]SDO74128.1 type II secretion system protein E (GspE) [Desulforhopalus singaporensis]
MKKIGEILAEETGLSQEKIESALAEQQETGQLLGEILLRRGEIAEQDILSALGRQLQMEVIQVLPANSQVTFADVIPIGFLKKFKLVPILTDEDQYIAVNNPLDFQPLDTLRSTLQLEQVRAVIAPAQQILNVINYAYDMTQTSASEVMQDIDNEDPERLFSEIEEVGDLLDDTSDSPVVRLVNLMFSQAARDNASDIHIEPYQNSLKIRQRLDGILYDMLSPPKHVQSALVSRIKIMAKLNIAEKRLPQDGRIELKVANNEIDVRVSTLPTAFGERVVLRLLKKTAAMISLGELGMSRERLAQFTKEIRSPNGIVLVTGPTGSGKTTTLYAALTAINSTDINIITVEDPIEYRISGIGQVQVNPKINLTFASGLRSIVRQDPDVILVGEIRDSETAEIAIQSALTGHLVFSTLHTTDSAGAVTRLSDMGIESFLIASSVNAIVAQRLVRIICRDCREEYEPAVEFLENIGMAAQFSGKKVFRGKGCVRCQHTGYKGRVGIFETLIMDDDLKKLVLKTSDANQIKAAAVANGMITLKEDGVAKVLDGTTTIEELYRVSKA